MRKALTDIGTDLARAADPRLWTKEHPWASLGVALVGGFAATTAVVPSKRETPMKKLQRIERMLAVEDRVKAAKEETAKKAPKPGFGAQLIKQVIGLVQPALVSAVAAGVRGKMEQQAGDGHDGGAPKPNAPWSQSSV